VNLCQYGEEAHCKEERIRPNPNYIVKLRNSKCIFPKYQLDVIQILSVMNSA
jgi:hypothetical protein